MLILLVKWKNRFNGNRVKLYDFINQNTHEVVIQLNFQSIKLINQKNR